MVDGCARPHPADCPRMHQRPGPVPRRCPRDGTTQAATAAPVANPSPWWNDEVFYEVFVRSFSDSDGDGNGDLKGLSDKARLPARPRGHRPVADADHPVARATTATTPPTTTPSRPTTAPTPTSRTWSPEAHERGIKVIVDLVLNHTSSEHPWFLDSATGPDSPKRDWYVWSDTNPGTRTCLGNPGLASSGTATTTSACSGRACPT